MKYNNNNKPVQCFMKNSTWYKGAARNSRPVGVLWHDTGAGNPNISRYVQPHETDPDYAEKIQILGKNKYNNDWNHLERQAGVNAFIGKLADGSIATVQVGELDIHPWGCGVGAHGSCNGCYRSGGRNVYTGEHWVQFEICDDGYNDKAYFDKVYKEAVEFTAYICQMYNIDPHGTYSYRGFATPTILCHGDSTNIGMGSDHQDVLPWFKKMGKTMNDVRNDVAALLGGDVHPMKQVDAWYCSHTKGGNWLGDILNTNDYSGILGKPIDGFCMNVTEGTSTYAVHIKGGNWLGDIHKCDKSDGNTGYAGIFGKEIDGLIMSNTATKLHYRVHTVGGKWLGEITKADKNDPNYGYAGIFGKAIDAIQVWADPIEEVKVPQASKPVVIPVVEPQVQIQTDSEAGKKDQIVEEPVQNNEPNIVEPTPEVVQNLSNNDNENNIDTASPTQDTVDVNAPSDVDNKQEDIQQKVGIVQQIIEFILNILKKIFIKG